jgi:hypothetical protein
MISTYWKLHDEFSIQRVHDILGDLEVNVFEAKLKDLIIYMKC